jgi:hypothetical protein
MNMANGIQVSLFSNLSKRLVSLFDSPIGI